MIFIDNRTQEQLQTHTALIMVTDNKLSKMFKKPVYVGWACKPEHMKKVREWAKFKEGTNYVRVVAARTYKPPKIDGYCKVYVVDDNHPIVRTK